MATTLTVGRSTATEPEAAAREAVGTALETARCPVFAFAFTTDEYDPDAIAAALDTALGSVHWAGCSAAGVFALGEWMPQGVVVGVLSAPAGEISIGVGSSGLLEYEPRAAGREAVVAASAEMG